MPGEGVRVIQPFNGEPHHTLSYVALNGLIIVFALVKRSRAKSDVGAA